MIIRSVISYILNLLDLFFTLHFVHKFDIEIEGNPLGIWILSAPWRILIFKVIIPLIGFLLLIFFRQNKIAVIGSWIIMIAYLLLNIYHLFLLRY